VSGAAPVLHNTQAPRTEISRPSWRAPAGATDCHFHIFGQRDKYPLSPGRAYTPLDASMADYARITDTLGLQRFVIVQASIYGTDNSCALDCVASWGQNRARAVVVIDESFDEPTLARMHEAGVRGVRFNAVSGNGTPLEQLHTLAHRAAEFGWHVQLYLHGEALPELGPKLAALPVTVVIDHMGQVATAKGTEHPEFQALLRLLESGRAWVKLCGYRSSSAGHPFRDMFAQTRALVAAAPERCLWGTDWPHPNFFGTMPDDGQLFDLLGESVPDEGDQRRILVDNPAALYGFA
jgi:predicted TIM-barrel fold metal-dependent hydrolase